MAGSEGKRGRRLAYALRASIAAILLVTLAACSGASGHGAHGKPSGHTPPGPRGSAALTGAPSGAGPRPVVLNPNSVKPAQQKQFAPYDESGKLTVSATAPVDGNCFATSVTVPVSGVFRCLADNTILDSCFAPVHESSPAIVACFPDPWSEGQQVRLAGALPSYDPVLTAGDPWGIQLANGVRCVSVTGAVPVLGKVDLTYQCDGSTVAGITTGDNGAIVAHYGPSSGPLEDVAVSIAWRGRSFRIGGA